MSEERTTKRGPRVMRSTSATWEIEHRWGPQFTDVSTYLVRRSADMVTVRGPHVDVSLPLSLAALLGGAITEAVKWEATDV